MSVQSISALRRDEKMSDQGLSSREPGILPINVFQSSQLNEHPVNNVKTHVFWDLPKPRGCQ